MLAPDEFVEVFANVYSYAAPILDPGLQYDWIIIHKGFLYEQLDAAFMDAVVTTIPAVFANDVFTVFSNVAGLKPLSKNAIHVASVIHLLANRPAGMVPAVNQKARLRPLNFATLDVEGVREVMNERYLRDSHDEFGGYEHPHHWDRIRYHEVDRLLLKLIGDVSGLNVLEIGCGIGRNAHFFEAAANYLGTDLSDVAIAKARQRAPDHPTRRFEAMDAMDLKLEDATFNLVLGAEIIEHVQDADKMLRGIHRVLKPGGRFLFNSANRDSLHLRMVRALGLPEFRGTYEHFREFGYAEMCGILDGIGFDVESSEGIFLHPYLGVPGIDDKVHACALDNPEMVAVLRELGERAGPEYGFEFLIAARKRS